MQRRTRILTVGVLLLIVALSALACEKRTPAGQGNAATGGGGGNTSAAPARTASADPTALKATMKGEGGSQVAGTAELVAGTPGTKIIVEVKSLPAGQHAAYIYHQSCAGSGERHGPLAAFVVDGDTATSTTSFVSLSLRHFSDESHFIVIHSGTSDNPGAAISCGEIEDTS